MNDFRGKASDYKNRVESRIQWILGIEIPTKVQILILALILIITLLIRISNIDTPTVERTHWKEIDYINVSQNYWIDGYHFLVPSVTWPATPPRYTGMELPIVPFGASILYGMIGFNSVSVRLIPLISFIILGGYTFLLVKRELGPFLGLLTALAVSFMPLYHPFGKYLFSEPTLLLLSAMVIYHFAEWTDEKRWRDWGISLITLTLAVSLKPTAAYLLVPLSWIVFRKYRFQFREYTSLALLFVASLLLPFAWYLHSSSLETAGIAQFSIFSGHNKFQSFEMLTSIDWYRIMYQRIHFDILGGKIGLSLFILGLLFALRMRIAGLFFAYLTAIGVFFMVVAEGQIDAPYRQLTILVPAAVFMVLGAVGIVAALYELIYSFAHNEVSVKSASIFIFLGCVIILIMIPIRRRNSIFRSRESNQAIHPDRWNFAQQILLHTTEESLLIVSGEYTVHVGGNDISPVLFYYTGLKGWNLAERDWTLEEVGRYIELGATHLAFVPTYGSPSFPPLVPEEREKDLLRAIHDNYKELYAVEGWYLFQLGDE